MIVSGTEPESASAGDVLLPRPAATGSPAENMAVFFLFSTLGLRFVRRRPLGGRAAHWRPPFLLVGSQSLLFFLPPVLRAEVGPRPFNNATIVQPLRSSDPSVLFPRLSPSSSRYLPFRSSSPTPLYPFIPPSFLPLFLSARPLLRE